MGSHFVNLMDFSGLPRARQLDEPDLVLPKRSRSNKQMSNSADRAQDLPSMPSQASELASPVIHHFKQYHQGYTFREPNFLLLHENGKCTTEKAPSTYHGNWQSLDETRMLIDWNYNYKGDPKTLVSHVVRKIDRTNCWELIQTDGSWHYILIPVE